MDHRRSVNPNFPPISPLHLAHERHDPISMLMAGQEIIHYRLGAMELRIRRLEDDDGPPPKRTKWAVSMVIDWRMIAAVVLLVLGLTGILTVEKIRHLIQILR
ncbi:MAG: hypothetical protein OEL78_01600 [Hyphomicrobiales bacterium]|nr:hypothetical protein [Hyphomicrobiales bacterium]